MQRDMYKAVTLSVLIPVSPPEAEGETFYEEPISVRSFTNDDLDKNSVRGKKTWLQVEKWRQTEMLNLVALVRALGAEDAVAIERAYIALKSTSGPLVLGVAKALIRRPGFAQSMLVKELSKRLDDVRFVLWQQNGQVAPGLLCPDVPTALLIHIVMSAVGAKAGLRLCPKCGQAFMQKRTDQDYCSIKCREAHRIARWRAERRISKEKRKNKRSEVTSSRRTWRDR